MKTNKLMHEFGFGIIPKNIMKDPNINLQAKGIYAYLCAYAGNKDTAFPSIDLITHELGIGKDTFYKYLKELKESGYIEVSKERNGKGQYKTNIYKLLPYPKKPDMEMPDTETPDTETLETNNNNINNNSINNNNISTLSDSKNPTNNALEIYEYWNSKEIVKHRKLTNNIKRAINGALADYKKEEIMTAIDNYEKILQDNKYYFKYRWTLKDFLQRGLEKFIDWNICSENYKKDKVINREADDPSYDPSNRAYIPFNLQDGD